MKKNYLCRVCFRIKAELTNEHVPPQSVGNSGSHVVHFYRGFQKSKKFQNGVKYYSTCENCRKITTNHYERHYTSLVNRIRRERNSGFIHDFNPAFFMKRVISFLMAMSQFPPTHTPEYSYFVQHPKSTLNFDTLGAKLYMFATKNKQWPLALREYEEPNEKNVSFAMLDSILNHKNSKYEKHSVHQFEFAPVGFLLTDKKNDYSAHMFNISDYALANSRQKIEIPVLPIVNRASPFVNAEEILSGSCDL